MKKRIIAILLSATVMTTSLPLSNLAYADDFSSEANLPVDGDSDVILETDTEDTSTDDLDISEDILDNSEENQEVIVEDEGEGTLFNSEDIAVDIDNINENSIMDPEIANENDIQELQAGDEYTYGDYKYIIADNKVTITKYTGNASLVFIPQDINGYTVEKIGSNCFYGCSSLRGVSIKRNIKEVGEYAFYQCTNLSIVQINWENLEKIETEAFGNCSSLESITLPSSIKEVGSAIFEGCSSLKTAGPSSGNYNVKLGFTETMPDGLLQSSNVVEVTLPANLKNMGAWTFTDCNGLKKIELSSSLQSIPAGSFEYCTSLESITIPNNVKEIGDYAFYGCSKLVEVTGGNKLEKIGTEAFGNSSSLKSITLPSSIKEVGITIFEGCSSLKTAGPSSGNYNVKLGFTETMPDGLLQSSNVVEVILPADLKNMGAWAFTGCDRLKKIELSSSLQSIPSGAFENCTSLESITIPNNVKEIGDHAFYGCSKLVEVTGGNKLEKIGSETFGNCLQLKKVFLSYTVKDIVDNSFENCDVLTIYGWSNSYVETYAKANNIPFVSIGEVVDFEKYDYSSKLDQWLLDQGTSNAMNYLVKDMNFTNSAAVATFDSDFGFRVTEAWTNLLFRGASGWKEIFTKSTSRDQAREILMALMEKQESQIVELTMAEAAIKYSSVYVSTLKQANWAYAIEFGLNNQEIQQLADLCKEDTIANYFVAGNYDKISTYIRDIGGLKRGSKVVKCLEEYSESKKLADELSSCLKWGSAVLKFESMTDKTLKALYEVDKLWKADEMYLEMLAYIRDNCSLIPVSQAAGDLCNVIQGGCLEAFSYAATSINNTISDTVYEAVVEGLIEKVPYGVVINTMYHFSTGLSNILFHTSDIQKQKDNMRCIAYIGSYIGKWMTDCRLQYLTGDSDKKTEYARRTVYAYYMLLKIRMAGEESLQAMMKYSRTTWKRAYGVSREILDTLKSNEKWLKDSNILAELSTSVVACPVNVEIYDASGKLVQTLYDGKEVEGYIGDIYYSVFYNPLSEEYTKIIRTPVNRKYSIKCIAVDMGSVDYWFSTVSKEGASIQQEISNIPIQKNSQIMITDFAGNTPTCTLKDGENIRKYTPRTSTEKYIPVTSIKSEQNQLNLKKGNRQRINVSIMPENASVQGIQWESSSPEIVSINSEGVVTALKKGSALITAKAISEDISVQIKIVVTEKSETVKPTLSKAPEKKEPAVLKLNASSVILQKRQSTTGLKITSMAKWDSVVSWKSSNTKVVKVSKTGKLTAQNKTGKATVTVTLKSGLSKKVTVKVQKAPIGTTKITGLKKTITLAKGKSLQLKPSRQPFTCREKITYTSSNKKVVSVNSKGKIKALKQGKVKITVKSGKKKFVITVIVKKK